MAGDLKGDRFCQATIPGTRGRVRCSNRASIEIGAHYFCRVHDPARVKARHAARDEAFQKRQDADKAVVKEAQALAARLGAGEPHYDLLVRPPRHTESLLLTFEEVRGLLKELGR